MRVLYLYCHPQATSFHAAIRARAQVDYYALYHMNVASEAKRVAFMEKVHVAMARF